ncbi:hypothetical protein [Mastigocoleus testarum]|uniref:Uncharacterized protein n=1 Tax=Mastigocoleus testarum BC008 TaxID=371196 RepID=A0A0V7ZLY6_9CYAN|nr:hypothetical protein [Mastigocoleus testarum]KST65685.1 hypothetical protein BC008_22155 [Mastigocoleus testarum BC008]
MSTRYLAAVFFISQEENISLETLLEKVQATDIGNPHSDVENESSNSSESLKALYCNWSYFTGCIAWLKKLDYYLLLVIWFSQSQFLRKLPLEDLDLPVEEDPNLELALTFRDACEEILPEVAYIITHLDRAEWEEIVKIENKIQGLYADFIANQGGLTYLSGLIADVLTPRPQEYERDNLPVKNGKLVFSSRGSYRWF